MAKRKTTRKKAARSRASDRSTPDSAAGEKAISTEPGFEGAAAPDAPPTRDTGAATEANEVARAFARLHVWHIQAVRDVLFVAGVIALVWLGYALRAVTVPLLVALLLAYLFEPVISRLCRHPRITRPLAIGGLLAVVGSIVLLILALITPFVVGQSTKLVREIQSGELRGKVARLEPYVPDRLEESFDGFLQLLPAGMGAARSPDETLEAARSPEENGEDVADETDAVQEAGAVALTDERVRQIVNEELRESQPATRDESQEFRRLARTVEAAAGILGAVVGIGLLAFLIPFYFFFFSLWYHDVLRFARQLIPEKNRPRTLELLRKMDLVVSGFVRGRIVISFIMGALLAIGWFAFDVPYALPLGIITGIFCAVPYLGVLGIPMAVGLLFFDRLGDPANSAFWWLWILLLPTAWFIVVQLIEGYMLIPMIAGKATGLDPVTIVVVVLAGGSVLGIYGMLLAIPVAACGRILFTDVFLPRIQAWTRGELSDPLPIERD